MVSSLLQLEDKHCIDIWSVALDKTNFIETDLLSTFDDAEKQRYQRLHKNHRQSYLLSHAACREILSRYLGCAASEIKYILNEHGKPGLDNSPIAFNLSHSHQLALIAVSAKSDIGVDVEFVKPKTRWDKLAKRFFNPDEYQYLIKLSENQQLENFYQLWTRKEAFIKALGTGLSTPLKNFDSRDNERIIFDDNTHDWYQQDLTLASTYKACVVQNTLIKKIRYYVYA